MSPKRPKLPILFLNRFLLSALMANCKDFYFPMDKRDFFIFLVMVGMSCMWSSTHKSPAATSSEALYFLHLLNLWICHCNAWALGQAVLELLQLGLSQRCMAALNALVHLLHGHLAVLNSWHGART